ncbi:MAG: hypothetical protein QNJ14_18275 [Woeseiaceae bacterium]|nr:hypothetical protein [Woeseiaceae bacterium]
MSVQGRIRNALLNPTWVCFAWFGLTAGVSLLATPVRFTAESITRPVALDVGRVVFAALNKAELAALVLLLVTVRLSGRSSTWWAWCSFLILVVLAQSAWLIPELSARTDLILEGGTLPPSNAHAIYSTLELAKIGVLLYLGFRGLAETQGP